MALRQRNTTRWIARVGTWTTKAVSFVLEVLKSFLNFKEGDGLLTKGMKTADLATRRAAYFAADYYLFGVSAAMFAAMKTVGFSFLWIFVVLWVFDFVVASAFILFYEKTGEDLSLGVDFRRAVDTINGKSRLAGLVTMLWIICLSIVWTGPEKVITFFRKEIRTIPRIVMALVSLTAMQALIWAVLYGFGYDFAVKLF
jgi:hypothetical protein